MTITGERFQEDMEYLEYNGYTPLLSADLVDHEPEGNVHA